MTGVDALLSDAAQVPFAIAVLVVTVAVVRSARSGPAELAAGLSLGLEFFLAAGLLRLSALDDFGALGVVAVVVLLRRVIGTGIRYGLRALGLAGVQRIRA